jgi:hypothetical protein
MTSQSPRIYLYKITFEEVSYYYYGVHKEKKFGEYYMGSPKTNKWCWELYTPKKQILEIFPYTDEGYIKAQEVEGRLIRPVYNTDKWCLNESCLGVFSLEQKSKAGKIGGKKIVEEKIGLFGRTKEEMKETSRKGGEKAYELGIGVHSLSSNEKKKCGSKGGKIAYEMKIGVHGRSKEKMSEDGKKSGKIAYELGVGVHGRSKEKMTEDGRKGSKNTNFQVWECTETGYTANPGNLSKYQKARGIDTSKRKRIS